MEHKYSAYTHVDRKGNDILFMGYDLEGNPVREKIRFSPEAFVENKEGEFSTIKHVKCARKEFDTMSDAYEFSKNYKDIMKIYGCQDYVRQFIGRCFRGELKFNVSKIAVWFFDIETSVNRKFPDPQTAEEEITLITMYNRKTKKIYTWSRYTVDDPTMNSKQTSEQIEFDKNWIREQEVDLRVFSSEESMLKDFLVFVKSNRLDILSGWNSKFFDVPYIANRIINVLGETLANYLSPWKIIEEHREFVNNREMQTYDFVGTSLLDLMDLYKKFNPGSKEEWTLSFISELELGETKVELPGEDFKDSYTNYWSTFVRYNIIDVVLLAKLDAKKQIIDLACTIAYMAKCNFADVTSAMRTWESLIYNYFLERNIVEEWDKKKNHKTALEGAYVKDPIPGAYKWVVSVDCQSMYPSIMMQNNLSPETVIGMFDEEDYKQWCSEKGLDPFN